MYHLLISLATATALATLGIVNAQPPVLSRDGWTVEASSEDTTGTMRTASMAIDGDEDTLWHTDFENNVDTYPHSITLDTQEVTAASGLSYLPRQDGSANGRIGLYEVFASNSSDEFDAAIAMGTFEDDASLKMVVFDMVIRARYFRLKALSEAGSRGPWASAAEINLFGTVQAPPSPAATEGVWGPVIDLPLVAVAGALLPNGQVLMWSAFAKDDFGGARGLTQTAFYDPTNGNIVEREVSETRHDMFCPGINMLEDGSVLVNGGSNSQPSSVYTWSTDTWSIGRVMNTARGYNANTMLSDGRSFTLGGSWSGGLGGKDGEVWTSDGGWVPLPGCPVGPIVTDDPEGVYRADNHGWFFGWLFGWVFHAGPSKAMNWYGTEGEGAHAAAGMRPGLDAMNGNAIMYDAGKILVVGGSTAYTGREATTAAELITLDRFNVSVEAIAPMSFARAYHSSLVLPDGTVLVVGGMSTVRIFNDNTAILEAELWDPTTQLFTTMAAMTIPRTYHSIALLLADGRVMAAGGGLCGDCSVNHLDAQIFSPPYLFNEDGTEAIRPVIQSAPSSVTVGDLITVSMDQPIASFSIIRNGAATHAVNNDQRRIALDFSVDGNSTDYAVSIPGESGIVLPGYWMLFAINEAGVPSVGAFIQITLS